MIENKSEEGPGPLGESSSPMRSSQNGFFLSLGTRKVLQRDYPTDLTISQAWQVMESVKTVWMLIGAETVNLNKQITFQNLRLILP